MTWQVPGLGAGGDGTKESDGKKWEDLRGRSNQQVLMMD